MFQMSFKITRGSYEALEISTRVAAYANPLKKLAWILMKGIIMTISEPFAFIVQWNNISNLYKAFNNFKY